MYGGVEYAGGGYAGGRAAAADSTDTTVYLAVEVSFTAGALSTPAWVDVGADVRAWDSNRGRNRELERFQPGRASVVLSNLQRQYDAQNAAGPFYGNLKPMRRVRIRETFQGATFPAFDGFVDGWRLDYPAGGKDATATLMATDGFKMFARTELEPKGAYHNEVVADAPVIWWQFDELSDSTTALDAGSGGFNATYDHAITKEEGLTYGNPGRSLTIQNSTITPGLTTMGAYLPDAAGFDLIAGNFSVECWVRPGRELTSGYVWWNQQTTTAAGSAQLVFMTDGVHTRQFEFVMVNAINAWGVMSPTMEPNVRYHIVCKYQNSTMSLWINGVEYTTIATDAAGAPYAGRTTTGTFLNADFAVGHRRISAGAGNWVGEIDELAIYKHATNDPLSDARIVSHYAAGTTPWSGEQVGTRVGRILDEARWPAGWRDIAAGNATLQSVLLKGAALDYLHRLSETEFGNLYMDRTGNVRFVSRATLFARTPVPGVIFGDGAGEIGYRAIAFDDGDSTIRNRATISRENGVPKSSEDVASVTEFGRFDFKLDGLLHNTDAHSQSYATFIVAEYKALRRRVTTLTVGPAAPGAAATLYPQMLGREIGDAITVRHRPPGGGATFEQVCVIEGIAHSGAGFNRTTTWRLSPDIAGSF